MQVEKWRGESWMSEFTPQWMINLFEGDPKEGDQRVVLACGAAHHIIIHLESYSEFLAYDGEFSGFHYEDDYSDKVLRPEHLKAAQLLLLHYYHTKGVDAQ